MSKEIRPYNDITPYDDKSQRHGFWEVYRRTGLSFKCYFVNDRVVGYYEWYGLNGNLDNKTFWIR